MAKINFNSLLYGVSGKMGNFVFKNINGNTYICQAADKPVKPPSEAQLRVRRRFAGAVAWGKKAKMDEELYTYYRYNLNESSDVYHAAIRDYQCAPKIQHVKGAVTDSGLELTILVKDDTGVTTCWLEYNNERLACTGKGDVYRVVIPGHIKEILVKVSDMPGNIAEVRLILSEAGYVKMAG
jgi:hypothetical protein